MSSECALRISNVKSSALVKRGACYNKRGVGARPWVKGKRCLFSMVVGKKNQLLDWQCPIQAGIPVM